MPFADLLGRAATLPILRFGSPGAFLAVDPADESPEAPTLLLPGGEIPEGATEGDELDVFVYLDSEARPIATLRTPKVTLGEVAFLEVTSVTSFGAFVDWGLQKELLVPFAEQTRDLRVGERHPIGLYVDDTGRLAGTMRIAELLKDEKATFELDEWVVGEAWRNEPEIGLFAILERAYVGLVPAAEPHTLSRGEEARFRVSNVLPDGKIELSLRGHAHEEIEGDAARVLAIVGSPGAASVSERATPEEIRARFGLSKKAFKRAVGRLLRQQAVVLDREGNLAPAPRA